MDAKKRVRGDISARVRRMTPAARCAEAAAIFPHLDTIEGFRQAHCVGLYAATPLEVATDAIFRVLVQRGVVVCYPRINDVSRRDADFRRLNTLDDLEPGPFGIREPSARAEIISPRQIDCVCVPGRAFDRQGHRLGSGGGYYDRWLIMGEPVRIGLAFACQLVDAVPHTITDVTMHFLVTATGAMTCPRGEDN